MRFCRLLVVLFFPPLLVAQSSYPSKHPVHPRENTPQEILLLFGGLSNANPILLMLNNNRSDVTTVSLTAYTDSGQESHLPDISLVSRESRLLDLSPILDAAGLHAHPLGFLKVTYSGVVMEVGAQLTLYPTINGSALDSPRSLAIDFRSTRRSAAFVVPHGGGGQLSLTNESQNVVSGTLLCSDRSEPFTLNPNATYIRKLVELAPGPLNSMAESCDIDFQGDAAAVRPFGFVSQANYSAPIRFYDPQSATSTNITAVGLQTSSKTFVALHNTRALPISVLPVLRESSETSPTRHELPPVVLPPYGTMNLEINAALQTLLSNGQLLANLVAETNSPNGSVVGALTQQDAHGINEDIPFRTSNPAAFDRGSYPLRWTDDYTNRVTIANTSTKTLGYRAMITAGDGIYVFPKEMLQPNTTKVFDIDAVRTKGIPDVAGRVLSKSASYGKFLWSELSNGKNSGLLGRQSLASISAKRRSSFSCGETCEEIVYVFPFFTPPDDLPYNTSASVALMESYQSANVPYHYEPITYTQFVNDTMPYIYTEDDNPSISIGADSGNQWAFLESAPGVGSDFIYATVTDYYFVYEPAAPECDYTITQYFMSQPTGSKPTVAIQDDGPGTPYTIYQGQTIPLVAVGQPAGGAYSWSANTQAVTIAPSNQNAVGVTGASVGTATVSVDYTLNQRAADRDARIVHVIEPAYVTNFHQANATSTNGVLTFSYVWESSTGNASDLSGCRVREYVDYPATNANAYASPPYAIKADNPTVYDVPGARLYLTDNQTHPDFIKPYVSNNFSTTQKFQFSCPNYQNGNFIDLLTGITINRDVSPAAGTDWKYTVTKSGLSATINPLP